MAEFSLKIVFVYFFITTGNLISARDKRSSRRVLPQPQDDVDVCLGNFQVSETTIIRTQDSRAMGAKYLNETELPSKEACMKWCCDTSKCNVAVYEEKNKGSCYIFDCSPIGDFKCRFTAHEHYTTAILRVNRHSYDLDKWGTEAKHEEELSRLRDEDTTTTNIRTTTTLPTTTAPTTMITQQTTIGPTQIAATIFVSSATPGQKPPDERRCSRFQFECRNTSECIAIYNACDGIPQCSDASDESVELGCPMDNRRRTPIAVKTNDQLSNGYKLNSAIEEGQASLPDAVNVQPMRDMSPQNNKNYNQYMALQLQHQQQHQPKFQQQQKFEGKAAPGENGLTSSVFAHKNGGFVQSKTNYENQLNNNNYQRPIPQAHGPYMKSFGRADDSSESAPASYSEQMPVAHAPNTFYGDQDYDNNGAQDKFWPRNKDTYERPRMSGDHHEGHLIQTHSHDRYDSRGQESQAPPAPMEQYYPEQKGYSDRKNYQHTPQMKPMPNIPDNEQYENYANTKPHRSQEHHKHTEESPDKMTGFTDTQMDSSNSLKIKQEQTNVADMPKLLSKDTQVSQELIAESTSSLLETTTAALTTSTGHHHNVADHEALPHSQMNKVEVNFAEVERQSETNGAVVALTLGLTVTGVLVVLVGCRLRVVRRHLRRGRSPFAHDADYLVNGMYL